MSNNNNNNCNGSTGKYSDYSKYEHMREFQFHADLAKKADRETETTKIFISFDPLWAAYVQKVINQRSWSEGEGGGE